MATKSIPKPSILFVLTPICTLVPTPSVHDTKTGFFILLISNLYNAANDEVPLRIFFVDVLFTNG